MKHVFSTIILSVMLVIGMAQTTFNLEVIAEGNFGTPNGDVFRRNTTTTPATTSAGIYQLANATGIDVLQDYEVAGNKAILLSKSLNFYIVIASYPSLAHEITFNDVGAAETIEVASESKAYVSTSMPSAILFIDLNENTIATVNDPNGFISSYTKHMVYANGAIYASMGEGLIKIDTTTNTATKNISLGIGRINNLIVDSASNMIYALSGSNYVSIDTENADALGAPVKFSNLTSINHARFYNHSIYFWNKKDLYIYSLITQGLADTPIYTSTLGGNSFSFGYGRSFDIDEKTGDFVICSAGGFVAPGFYEVVDGHDFTLIEAGEIADCAIPNKCVLNTYRLPIPDQETLANLTDECSTSLTAPTADNGYITAITKNPISYSDQGEFTVTWEFINSTGISTQTQEVIIKDVTLPVVGVEKLDVLNITCQESVLETPLATDNCSGKIFGETKSPLRYATSGTYNIEWYYTDEAGNGISQFQVVNVTCAPNSIEDLASNGINAYPNPTTDELLIKLNTTEKVSIELVNLNGMVLLHENKSDQNLIRLDVANLPRGMYLLQVSWGGKFHIEKVVLN